ncbi:MAG: protein kinase [Hamadaea sp.]|nr:protein kinase [Hamadaea sp.]
MKGIADYEFVRHLGSGNHGDFYLARRPERLPIEADLVAVKVLAGESTQDTFRRAARELAAFAAVRSPYLVAAYDAGQQDGLFFYSMEYLPGGSLADRRLPAAQAITAVAHAARAAAALHAAGIVHRDVKPGNILLHESGAKLSDLGLAQVFTEGITITGMGAVATVEFVDPALLLGEPARPGNDVWSLACTLHHQLAGTGVYGDLSGQDGLMLLRTVLATTPAVAPDLPEPVAALIGECLTPQRPTAAEFARRLEEIA